MSELIQARVLVGGVMNGIKVKPNDLVEGPAELVAQYVKNGQLDTHKNAVNYCIKAGAKTVSLLPPAPVVEVTDEMIIEAIKQLDENDAESWTAKGLPQISAIEAIIGGPVKAADRDAAWRIVQDEAEAEAED